MSVTGNWWWRLVRRLRLSSGSDRHSRKSHRKATVVRSEPVAIPLTRTCPYSPPPEHPRLREQAPISRVRLPTGAVVWALTRYDDIRAMLADPRFSSDRRRPGFPLLLRDQQPLMGRIRPVLVGMDGPEHRHARRAVTGEFTVKRMAALRPRIQFIVDELIDAMLARPRPVDLVPALALPAPSKVICELLGVPFADHEFFTSRSALLLSRTTSGHERARTVDEVRSYLEKLIAAKARRPTDDLLGRQILRQRADGAVNHDSLVSLAFVLLIAGHETTANMITLGVLALLEHPQALDAIRDEPGRTQTAVEELLRYFTVVEFGTARVATEEVRLGGVRIRAGDGVIGLANTANRDPDVFANPDELDVERATARRHLSFGFGAHQCLGQSLARLELQIVFDTLFRRIPGLRLAVTADELRAKDDAIVYGLSALPLTW
jgi:cytochrome P450